VTLSPTSTAFIASRAERLTAGEHGAEDECEKDSAVHGMPPAVVK